VRILPIINRLKEACPLLDGRVEFLQSLIAPDDEEIVNYLPMCWVYPIGEQGDGNFLLNDVAQRVKFQFGVIIAAAGATEIEEPLADVREEIKAALVGFSAGASYGKIRMTPGELVDISHRVVWWQDIYEYIYIQQSE
jgi:hypothetical protein